MQRLLSARPERLMHGLPPMAVTQTLAPSRSERRLSSYCRSSRSAMLF